MTRLSVFTEEKKGFGFFSYLSVQDERAAFYFLHIPKCLYIKLPMFLLDLDFLLLLHSVPSQQNISIQKCLCSDLFCYAAVPLLFQFFGIHLQGGKGNLSLWK